MVRATPGGQRLCPSELLCPAFHHVWRESGSAHNPSHAPLGPSNCVGNGKRRFWARAAETDKATLPWDLGAHVFDHLRKGLLT